jgi:transcriptional regulator GlxA family with amidase domain
VAARGPLNIAIFLFDGAEELDWAGPWEVLSAWARRWPDDGVTAFTVAESTDRPVACAKGLRVLADHTWADAPPVDVLLVPGGDTRAVTADERVLARVRDLASADKLVTSVCTGAFVLQAAGLLEGRPATTHWGSIDGLRDLGVDVRPDDRFVDAGAVVTAAGVSAGIDMALHLVARLHSRERAQEVRRYIQYDPEPPV